MGPVHGPFIPSDLRNRPPIESFTSIATFMRLEEIQDVVNYPTLKTFRRLISNHDFTVSVMAPSELTALTLPSSLETFDVIIVGKEATSSLESTREEIAQRLLQSLDDSRVQVRSIDVHDPHFQGRSEDTAFQDQALVVEHLWRIPLAEFLGNRDRYFYSLML
ncbi:hypothetical protein CC2G_013886 [Coprinopsis cinerea AmutBmut pab1-1]|nr:hypothetical protein CC2G_013886 [Coprinopsis cinerea AmutBmut pab1-1]